MPSWLAKCLGEMPRRLQWFESLASLLMALQAVLSTLIRGDGGMEGRL